MIRLSFRSQNDKAYRLKNQVRFNAPVVIEYSRSNSFGAFSFKVLVEDNGDIVSY